MTVCCGFIFQSANGRTATKVKSAADWFIPKGQTLNGVAQPWTGHGLQVLLHRTYVSCIDRRSNGVHSLVRSFSDLYSPKRGSRSTASW